MKRSQLSALALALLGFGLCGGGESASAQTPAPSPSATPAPTAQTTPSPSASTAPGTMMPTAAPADVASVESIVAALYDVISGPAGKKRDWNRFRSLFAPGARMIPTLARRPPGTAPDAPPTGAEEYAARVITPEDYVTRSGAFLEERGFFEREVARRVEQFGHIAHVFSTYEARHKQEDPAPFMRGINSIQLVNDGKRWWVVTIFWEAESARLKLPEKYLKSAQ
jgi:hypothetical protein